MITSTHIKGFVIDSKPDRNAVFVMQPDGRAIIVKSDDKKFGMLLNGTGIEQGFWFCCRGDAVTSGKTVAFTAMADVSSGDEIVTEKDARITCWNNHCGGVYSTGYCLNAPRQKWNRMVDIYDRVVGAVEADRVRAQTVWQPR